VAGKRARSKSRWPIAPPGPWEVSSKANKWQGQNIGRWQSSEFDALFRAAEGEMDAVKRAALFIQMNDLVVRDGYVLPIIDRTTARALNHQLVAPLPGWRSDMASLPRWYRSARVGDPRS
jgi:peptide/nickel transport system substrate-binding protein